MKIVGNVKAKMSPIKVTQLITITCKYKHQVLIVIYDANNTFNTVWSCGIEDNCLIDVI